MPLIETEKLTRLYQLGDETVTALPTCRSDGRAGDFVAVMGPSGSGKSTFMNVIGCLDRPTSGTYRLDGEGLDAQRRRARRRAQPQDRLRVPAVPSARPARRAGQCRTADDLCRRRARRAPATSAEAALTPRRPRRTACITARRSFPAASSSASRSRARWSTRRKCCSPTSRPARSTAAPRSSSWRCSRSSTAKAPPS